MSLAIELSAVVVTVRDNEALVLCLNLPKTSPEAYALPSGPFLPESHRTFDLALRAFVREQTGFAIGYVEQLYSFGDDGRQGIAASAPASDPEIDRVVSVGYLALTPQAGNQARFDAAWVPFHRFFPWEDWRKGKPEIFTREIEPRLKEWAERTPSPDEPARPLRRSERLKVGFGIGGGFDEEKVLERYELLYEAGLVTEAARDGRNAARQWDDLPELGRPMAFDHRRILATAMGRLRGKLKYRPVVFELLPPEFTLLELQKTVEAISGTLLHKQNFRRLVEQGGLVEVTGNVSTETGGRPAKLYRFRREVVLERPAPGLRVKAGRG